jgi:tetrahydromethanopterin S-methyltransferase subunit F
MDGVVGILRKLGFQRWRTVARDRSMEEGTRFHRKSGFTAVTVLVMILLLLMMMMIIRTNNV